MRLSIIMFSAGLDRNAGERREARIGLVELALLGERGDLEFVEAAVLVERLHQRARYLGLPGHGRGADPLGRFLDHARHLVRELRMRGLELPAHAQGRLRDQLQVVMARQVGPQADACGEVVIALGPRDEVGEAVLGELCAGIADGRLHDVLVAARHQHVGECCRQHPPQRDRLQMRLTPRARDLDQGRLVQPFRFRQHRSCDLDHLVERERADDLRRCRRDRCEAVGEQRPRRGLDLFDQALEYVVEHADVLVGVIHCIAHEQIGDAAQRLDPAHNGAVRERSLQFLEQVLGWSGGSGYHCPVLERLVRRRLLTCRRKWVGQFVAIRLRPCALAE
ncbi:hypothetical protein ABIF52_001549 [Bradyrhizobium japonicum]